MIRIALPDISRHVPALDGLRAISVLIVILAHFGWDRIVPGGFGVTVFFWISGFLITSQLLQEIAATGRIAWKRFYARRFLRLMPAAFVYITVAALLFRAAGGMLTAAGWLSAYFYGANYYAVFFGYLPLGPATSPLDQLWSLAVEEHFYLIWPLLLALLGHGRRAGWLVLGLCLAVLAWRIGVFQHCFTDGMPNAPGGMCGQEVLYRIYKGTDTRLDAIGWGAVVAVFAATDRAALERLLSRRWLIALAVAMLLAGFLVRGVAFRETWRYAIQSVALSVLIPAVIGWPSRLRAVLEVKPAVWIGRLSYSLYLWHWGGVTVADWMAPSSRLIWLVIAGGIGLVGAMISYYGVERPLLGLRRRFGSHATASLGPG